MRYLFPLLKFCFLPYASLSSIASDPDTRLGARVRYLLSTGSVPAHSLPSFDLEGPEDVAIFNPYFPRRPAGSRVNERQAKEIQAGQLELRAALKFADMPHQKIRQYFILLLFLVPDPNSCSR